MPGSHIPKSATQNFSLATLDPFFGVVQDVAADPKTRRKAALKIAEFLLPKGRVPAKAVTDEYGFKVNPDLARQYRDTVRERRSLARKPNRDVPIVREKIQKLEANCRAFLDRVELPCPTRYGVDQAARDQERLVELVYARAEAGLTEEQDSEEANLRMRVDLFRSGPQEIVRKRRKELEDVERRSRMSQLEGGADPQRLSRIDQSDLKLLRWLFPEPKPKPKDKPPQLDEDDLYRFHPFQELPAADGNFYPNDSKLVVKHNVAVQPTLEEMGVPADFEEFMDD